MSSQETDPARLDIQAFIQNGRTAQGRTPLAGFARLREDVADTSGAQPVSWRAVGEPRPVTGGAPQPWLHLHADAVLPLVCQRCLGPVDVPLAIDRDYRFVADEAEAAAQDDEAEEDLLVLSREFSLLALIEDELIMDLPVVPRHGVCPTAVKLSVEDEAFAAAEADKPHPFAGLAGLRTPKGD